MNPASFLDILRRCPLVASVQSSGNSAVEHPDTLARLAMASAQRGVGIFRCQGLANIAAIRDATGAPTIGLVKRSYVGTPVYITATKREVSEVLTTGSEIVALDGTSRPRPSGEQLADLVEMIHDAGALAMADCDSWEAGQYALQCGADLLGTTLAGYTDDSPHQDGPDFELLHKLTQLDAPVLAEGRYAEPWQAQAALRIGATGVVVGGALNDPVKQTSSFLDAMARSQSPVGAVDIGGTWLRFATFSADWEILSMDRILLPQTREERLAWIRSAVKNSGITNLGVSSAGTVDPATGTVIASKGGVPENVGSEYSLKSLGVSTLAINDGLATAWGHACLPQFAGRRVATLALGTGVGCGFVSEQQLLCGPKGQHTRLNDSPAWEGETLESILGGAVVGKDPDAHTMAIARRAAGLCVRALNAFYFPEFTVLCGGVGLSDWLDPAFRAFIHLPDEELPERSEGWVDSQIVRTPFGENAGLFGAAALALFPPLGLGAGS